MVGIALVVNFWMIFDEETVKELEDGAQGSTVVSDADWLLFGLGGLLVPVSIAVLAWALVAHLRGRRAQSSPAPAPSV